MVASVPRETLLLYVVATTEAVSMVSVAERSEPPQPQETKDASTNGSGSHDSKPAGSPEVGVATGSQLPEASLAPERQAEINNATRSQLP
jgi:hypothetical protein